MRHALKSAKGLEAEFHAILTSALGEGEFHYIRPLNHVESDPGTYSKVRCRPPSQAGRGLKRKFLLQSGKESKRIQTCTDLAFQGPLDMAKKGKLCRYLIFIELDQEASS